MGVILRRTTDLLLWVTAALGVFAVALTAVMLLTDSRPVIVQSGSMDPTHPVGSVTIVHRVDAGDIEVGDVVAVALGGGQRVLHRVVGVQSTDRGLELRTKGDANENADAEPVVLADGAPTWRAVAVVPSVGRVADGLRSPFAGFALATLLIGPLALGRSRDRRERRPAPALV